MVKWEPFLLSSTTLSVICLSWILGCWGFGVGAWFFVCLFVCLKGEENE